MRGQLKVGARFNFSNSIQTVNLSFVLRFITSGILRLILIL